MNYYRRFVGDYLRDTQHLTMEQDGGYGRLLDAAYTTEKPLPKDKLLVYRMVRAFSESERLAVDQILVEFFTLTNKGYVHKRVNEEIKLLNTRAKTAKQNGKHGGRPANPQGTHGKPTGLAKGNPRKSSPDSRLPDVQTPEKAEAEEAATAAFSALGFEQPFGDPKFQKALVDEYKAMTDRSSFTDAMERVAQKCKSQGVPVPSVFFATKREIEKVEVEARFKRTPQ